MSLERNCWRCGQHWELKQRKQKLYRANAAASAPSALIVSVHDRDPPFPPFFTVARFRRSWFYVLPLLSFIHTSPTNSVIRASLFFSLLFLMSHDVFNCCYLLVIVIYLQTHTHASAFAFTPRTKHIGARWIHFFHTAYNRALAVSGTRRKLTGVCDSRISCIETGDDVEVLLTSSLVYFYLTKRMLLSTANAERLLFCCVCARVLDSTCMWDSIEMGLCWNKVCVMCFLVPFSFMWANFFHECTSHDVQRRIKNVKSSRTRSHTPTLAPNLCSRLLLRACT